jgi:hypothetical protein
MSQGSTPVHLVFVSVFSLAKAIDWTQETEMKKKEAPKEPYFTRFLEKQELAKVEGARATLKDPSDTDEWGH